MNLDYPANKEFLIQYLLEQEVLKVLVVQVPLEMNLHFPLFHVKEAVMEVVALVAVEVVVVLAVVLTKITQVLVLELLDKVILVVLVIIITMQLVVVVEAQHGLVLTNTLRAVQVVAATAVLPTLITMAVVVGLILVAVAVAHAAVDNNQQVLVVLV